MPTLQEIQADIRKLKAIEQNKREIVQLGEERKKAERELKRLRSPRLQSFKRKFISANVGLGKALLSTGKTSLKVAKRVSEASEEIDRRERIKNLTKARKVKKSKKRRKK